MGGEQSGWRESWSVYVCSMGENLGGSDCVTVSMGEGRVGERGIWRRVGEIGLVGEIGGAG